ncbi:MAG TPA: S1-like domain-containing RNA-binding protein [Haloplasmataceae bacterium]
MEAGKMSQLIVIRESDIGYILSNDNRTDEILLHYNDTAGRKLNIGDRVKVFLYIDHKKRKAATLETPKITVFDCDWVEVVDVVNFGIFVDIGIRKDILLSKDDLPLNKELWPQVGDLLYAYLENDNDKALLLKLANRNEFLDIAQKAPSDLYGKKVLARVVKIVHEGVNVFTTDNYLGFIHHSGYKKTPRLGSLIEARVINVKENGEINLSLIPQKEIALKDDSDTILDYLHNHFGKMPLGDASSPEEIKKVLGISKAAFKRALGKLMKERKVSQNQEKTITSLVKTK